MKTQFFTGNKKSQSSIGMLIILLMLAVSCEEPSEFIQSDDNNMSNKSFKQTNDQMVYEFEGSVFDIASTPDGGILVGVNNGASKRVDLIKNGSVQTMTTLDAATDIQGIASIGSGNIYVSTGGSDLAQNGELYKVTPSGGTMVADLAAFEYENDPDANYGTQWKDQLCEAIDGYSAGPQNNPYKVAAVSGNEFLIADAAGNTVLSAKSTGEIDWKAILTPPLDENGDYLIRWQTGAEGDIPCYVQPVPTSVAVANDGSVFVGELTGALADTDGLPIGRSRIWKIQPGANHVVCSEDSEDCEALISGLTSIIDIEIGPDNLLYVVEFDQTSWLSLYIPNLTVGGSIKAYDLDGNLDRVVASGLEYPSAITFDNKGHLWLLENNSTSFATGNNPTVRKIY